MAAAAAAVSEISRGGLILYNIHCKTIEVPIMILFRLEYFSARILSLAARPTLVARVVSVYSILTRTSVGQSRRTMPAI